MIGPNGDLNNLSLCYCQVFHVYGHWVRMEIDKWLMCGKAEKGGVGGDALVYHFITSNSIAVQF